ncbi:tripartite tricarboxylate transporter TctB family protein [Streptomyces spiramenti]|uniref:Tripartite tricarboxylate transporter TctB family protein n=1 Tax=Streptomyces spiramenti TaxID=2720606 RepID=A0ABX1AK52_9ACTN|nr:tripartite tricarboxylate transporter TctB family protein [Streptomyces spiramenti]NJP67492.1 tripartite tricarboxylate transporter TctB family protein [Streptomyces spiramenti]
MANRNDTPAPDGPEAAKAEVAGSAAADPGTTPDGDTAAATGGPAATGTATATVPDATTGDEPSAEAPDIEETEEAAPTYDPESAPWTGSGAWVFPGLVALFGVIAVWGALTIESPPNSAPPGPGVVPGVIGALLLLVAAKMAFDNLRVARALRAGVDFGPPAPPTEWSPVALTLGALAVHVALLEPLGWLLAGTLLFWGVSYAFGARNPLRDAVVSLSMSAAVQVGFSFGLGLNLPGGVLEMVL